MMKKGNEMMFDTEKEARDFLAESRDEAKRTLPFCPLTSAHCRTDCVAYYAGEVIPPLPRNPAIGMREHERWIDESKWRVTTPRCNSALVTGQGKGGDER